MDLERLEFHSPWLFLLVIPALAAVWWSHRRKRPQPAIVFPTVLRFRGMRPTLRQRARVLLPLLHGASVLFLTAAVARPRLGDSRTEELDEGIAIQLVLDRSSSMRQEMPFRGRDRSRMDIVKDVFREFVSGSDEGLGGRRGDLIGLTTFARFTEESCPLVAQHEPLLTAVANLETVPEFVDRYGQQIRQEDLPRGASRREYRENPLNATAIGAGIRSAALSLIAAEEDFERAGEDGGYEIQSKVIIVLTDGQNNVWEYDPVDAGKLAAESGIRVYYILFSETVQRAPDIFGRLAVVGELSRDELLEVPRQVAGSRDRAFLATDGDSLHDIYRQIDALERTEIGRVEYRSYAEKYHLFLVPGVLALVAAVLLSETWLRRVP